MENGVFDLYPIKHMEIAVTGKDKKNRFILIPWSITNTGKQQEWKKHKAILQFLFLNCTNCHVQAGIRTNSKM